VKAEAAEVCTRLRDLQRELLKLAERHQNVVMPGYTHLQRAQPILLAHYFLAHMEAFERDHARLIDCARRADVLPLGSGAIAGSTIVLDRESIARDLGFAKLSQNSLDAIGDRDFVAEFLFDLAMIGMHLSRLSEELILWSTSEFGFITFSDAFSTGSSLMPQKKNPDMAELTRGKTGRLYGNLVALLTTLKGLPASYQRDLQEDKGPLFDSTMTVKDALHTFAAMLPEMTIHSGRMESAADDPNLLATDLAEYLVKKGMPFREAHEAVGKMVTRASNAKKALNNISLLEMQEISPRFQDDVLKVFDVRASLAKRTAVGAPSPENVAAQIARWKSLL
jgi:argininosuccinate lyase